MGQGVLLILGFNDLYVFIALCILIVSIFFYSMYRLISKGKILITANLIQPFLFCLLYFQIAATFGSQHYQYDCNPRWYHWVQFTGAHILRATDVLDFLEEYRIDMQNIKHNSVLSGIAIIIMHWMVDIFLIVCIVRLIMTRVKSWWEKIKEDVVIDVFIYGGLPLLFILAYILTVLIQGWQWRDLLFLWPVDNAIRVVDVGDTFQIFQWRLHQVESGWWNSLLAITFRLGAGIALGYFINYIRMKLLGGVGLTIEDLVENLSHSDWAVRKAATEALGKIGPEAREAIPHLIKALVNDDVRETTTEALEKIDPQWRKSNEAKEAVPAFIKALADEYWYVREPAARAYPKNITHSDIICYKIC